MNLVFSLYFFIYFYRVYSETSSLLRFENLSSSNLEYPKSIDNLWKIILENLDIKNRNFECSLQELKLLNALIV
jgi:hypothetical protein